MSLTRRTLLGSTAALATAGTLAACASSGTAGTAASSAAGVKNIGFTFWGPG